MEGKGIIIGISGKKRSGKDEVGKYIQEWNTSFKVKKFADKVKDIVCLLLGCTRKQLENEEWRTTPLGEEWWMYTDDCHQEPYLGGDMKMLDGYNTKLQKTTPRLLMQLIGTECGRDILTPNVWVNATMKEYKPILNKWREGGKRGYPNWVITDVRFPNEVHAIEKAGGIVIRVERPGIISMDMHESETSLDAYDFTYKIINDGTLEDLRSKLEGLLLHLQIKNTDTLWGKKKYQ